MSKLTKASVPYAQVANALLYDNRLSLKAKGLYAYLYAKPEGWNFSSERIALEQADGEKSVRSGLQELEQFGYLIRRKQSDGRVDYHLTDCLAKQPKQASGSDDPNAQNGNQPKRQPAQTGVIIKKELYKERSDTKKDPRAQGAGRETSEFINLFQQMNPSYQLFFSRPPQRAAAERLLKLHPLDWWQRFIPAYAQAMEDRYCPKAITPIQMEEKIGAIEIYGRTKKNEQLKKSNIVI